MLGGAAPPAQDTRPKALERHAPVPKVRARGAVGGVMPVGVRDARRLRRAPQLAAHEFGRKARHLRG
jgi:hypothetical protein